MTETARMLELLNRTFPDLAAMAPAEARAAADSRIRPAMNLDDVARVDDARAAVGSTAVPVRVYHPHTRREDAPVTVYAHGGGFLHGSVAGHDGFCRRWSRHTQSVVISVEYRVATEAEPPAAREDMVTAITWARAEGFAGNGVLVAGDSAGANLAAGAAIALHDRGRSPVVGQVLLYPFLDPRMSSASHRTRGSGYFVTSRLLDYYWRTYLRDRTDPFTPEVTPLAVTDLQGLPPAVIVTAGLDPLCDEGRTFAERLRTDGVPVLQRHYPDQFHGFVTIPGYGPAEAACDVLWADVQHLTTSPKKEHR
ncbi:alpha/beta hydrolase [Microbacterium sp. MC2]